MPASPTTLGPSASAAPRTLLPAPPATPSPPASTDLPTSPAPPRSPGPPTSPVPPPSPAPPPSPTPPTSPSPPSLPEPLPLSPLNGSPVHLAVPDASPGLTTLLSLGLVEGADDAYSLAEVVEEEVLEGTAVEEDDLSYTLQEMPALRELYAAESLDEEGPLPPIVVVAEVHAPPVQVNQENGELAEGLMADVAELRASVSQDISLTRELLDAPELATSTPDLRLPHGPRLAARRQFEFEDAIEVLLDRLRVAATEGYEVAYDSILDESQQAGGRQHRQGLRIGRVECGPAEPPRGRRRRRCRRSSSSARRVGPASQGELYNDSVGGLLPLWLVTMMWRLQGFPGQIR